MQPQPHPGIYINVGNTLEIAGAFCACWAVDRLAGFSWALILAGILMVVAAELIYDATRVRVLPYPLPSPRRRIREHTQRARRRATRMRYKLVYGSWRPLAVWLRAKRPRRPLVPWRRGSRT